MSNHRIDYWRDETIKAGAEPDAGDFGVLESLDPVDWRETGEALASWLEDHLARGHLVEILEGELLDGEVFVIEAFDPEARAQQARSARAAP